MTTAVLSVRVMLKFGENRDYRMNPASPAESGKSKVRNILRTIPFFSQSEEELSRLEKIISEKHFLKNEVILLEEDTPNYMYIVYSGKVKVVQLSYDGKEQILAIHKRGDYFGELALLDGKTSPATVIALEDSHVGLLSRHDFEQHLMKNEKVLREISFMLCSRLREAWLRLKVLSFADAENRVRAVLKLVSMNYGARDQRGIIITLRLTHKDIAAYASVSRETVTRLLDRLSHEGEIEFLEHNIILKPPFLNKTLVL